MRRALKITGWILLSLIALQITLYLLLKIPAVQTWVARKAIASLTKDVRGKVSIGKVYMVFFNKVMAKDFSIVSTDKTPLLERLKKEYGQSDTIVSVKDISVSFSLKGLINKEKHIRAIKIDGGVFNLQEEIDSLANLDRIFNLTKDTAPKKKSSFCAYIKKLSVKNFRFTLNNPVKEPHFQTNGLTDFCNLKVRDINVEAKNIIYKNGTLSAEVENISGTDKGGFKIGYLSGTLTVGAKKTILREMRLGDGKTKLTADYLSMSYYNARSLKYFTDSVVMGIKLKKGSYFNLATIGRISPNLTGTRLAFSLKGEVKGAIRHLKSKRLDVISKSGKSSVALKNIVLDGLPDSRKAVAHIDVERITTSGRDLSDIISSIKNRDGIEFLENLTPSAIYTYSGTLDGHFKDFTTDGLLTSEAGILGIKADVGVGEEFGGIQISGYADAKDIDLKALTGNNNLGLFTGEASLSLQSGEKNGGTFISIDSTRIRRLYFNGYGYRNIYAQGTYSKKQFDGKVICHDPNLDLMFQGLVSLNKKAERSYNFYANVPYANLAALNLDKRDSISALCISTRANFIQSTQNDVFGTLDIDNLDYTNTSGEYNIGSIRAVSKTEDNRYVIDLSSQFAKGHYEGSGKVTDFIGKIKSLIIYKHFGNLLGDRSEKYLREHGYIGKDVKGSDYNLTLQTYNTRGLFELVAPGMYLQDSTYCRVRVNPDDGFRLVLKSGRIAYNDHFLKNVHLFVSDKDSLITGSLLSKDVRAAGLMVDSARIAFIGGGNRIRMGISFKNDTTGLNNTNINSTIRFLKDSSLACADGRKIKIYSPIVINLNNSDITLKGEMWKFKPSSIILSDSLAAVNGLEVYNKTQSLKADGTLSKYNPDSLGITLKNFNIGIIDQFLDKSFRLHGYFSGKADLSMNKNNTKMFASIDGDSVSVNGADVGKMKILGKWSQPNERYNLLMHTKLNDSSKLALDGWFKPDSSYLDLRSTLNDLSVTYFEPFLSSVVEKTSGTINGKIHLFGPLDKLNLVGEDCHFKDFGFVLDYTQVPYKINGPMSINEKGLYFEKCTIADNYGGKGILSGSVSYNHFKNVKLNLGIDLENLQCLNTEEKDNSDFYGNAFASGTASITGNTDRIKMNFNVTTEPRTLVHIPVSGTSNATKTNILTFVKKEEDFKIDPYDTLHFASAKKVSAPTSIAVNLQLNVTPQANVWLEVNKANGDIIKANGNGNIGIDVDAKSDIFNLSGNYNIESGSYHFVLLGLAARDFVIQPGGSITFNGKIDNTILDLAALYKTKASISRLISDTSSVSSLRTVSCILSMSGKLTNPRLKFNIEVPDLDPTTKVKVESALNSDDKIQKQFAALLVSGGFMPDEQSGISSNSTMLYSNATEMLSNQLNNIFLQLGIPLDLGINYQPGDKGATDVFDVAVSTQLFNNRVLINGNIGNDPYAGTNNRDVIGNIDVEVKIDKNGKLRLTFFSHAADQYSNYLDESQRTGLGVAYQHEFNSFRELFRKKNAVQKEYEKQMKAKGKAIKAAEKKKRAALRAAEKAK